MKYILALVLFASVANAQIDSTEPLPKLIASVVDAVRAKDSTDSSKPILVPYRDLIELKAIQYAVPADLIAAIVQTESKFNRYASRYEKGYERNKVVRGEAARWSRAHGGIPTYLTELHNRSQSYGLGQPMGQLAREQGFNERYLGALFEPANNLDQTCIKIQKLLKRYGKDTLSAISSYNQGNNRKRYGTFENAAYVYSVSVAWKMYHKIFLTPFFNENKSDTTQHWNFGERNTDRDSDKYALELQHFALNTSYLHEGIASTGLSACDRDGTTTVIAAYREGEQTHPRNTILAGLDLTTSALAILVIAIATAIVFRLHRLLRIIYLRRFVLAELVRHPQYLPRSVDRRVRRKLKASIEKEKRRSKIPRS